MTKHWFDRFSQELAQFTSRRDSLRLAALLAGGLALGGAADVAAAKKTKKAKSKKAKGKKGKGKGKTHTPKRPGAAGQPTPAIDDCEAYLDPVLLDDCRNIRRQCQAPEHFCIHAIDSAGDDDRGVSCCPSHKTCCFFGCTDTTSDRINCGSCGNECAAGELCLGGACVCGNPAGCDCPNGLQLCSGQCVDTRNDWRNCGACGNSCGGGGRECINGACQCPAQYPLNCPIGCYREGFVCCGEAGACEPGAQCIERNGSWGCCWPNYSCP